MAGRIHSAESDERNSALLENTQCSVFQLSAHSCRVVHTHTRAIHALHCHIPTFAWPFLMNTAPATFCVGISRSERGNTKNDDMITGMNAVPFFFFYFNIFLRSYSSFPEFCLYIICVFGRGLFGGAVVTTNSQMQVILQQQPIYTTGDGAHNPIHTHTHSHTVQNVVQTHALHSIFVSFSFTHSMTWPYPNI